MEIRPATVMIDATLSVPDGYGSHNERQRICVCADCAAFVLTRQYVPTWEWDAMQVTTEYGDFGRCWGCRETAERRGSLRVVAMREP